SSAARLAAAGVRPGDRVLLCGENRPAWPIAYFGILRAGAVAVPIDPKLGPKQLANVVQASGATAALWGGEVEAQPGITTLDLDDATRNDHTLVPPDVSARASDLASIIYTSGTTGDPKGVML